MNRVVRGGLIQVKADISLDGTADDIKRRMLDKHVPLIEEAARRGVQLLCLQELFNGPYFCAEQQPRWYEMVERIPDGPTIRLMQDLAKKHGMVMVVPIYEEEITGIYYNAAAVIDADGTLPGQVSQAPYPACRPRLLGEVLFPSWEPWLSGVRHGGRQGRRLHLLRPPLS